jgi:hypothetical protein
MFEAGFFGAFEIVRTNNVTLPELHHHMFTMVALSPAKPIIPFHAPIQPPMQHGSKRDFGGLLARHHVLTCERRVSYRGQLILVLQQTLPEGEFKSGKCLEWSTYCISLMGMYYGGDSLAKTLCVVLNSNKCVTYYKGIAGGYRDSNAKNLQTVNA